MTSADQKNPDRPRTNRLLTQRVLGLAAFTALLIYIAWIGGPYLRSIIIRDAAVTTWINVVRSPIQGYFDTHPLYPGSRAAANGHIAEIKNPLADGTAVAKAEAALTLAKTRAAGLEAMLETLNTEIDARAKAAEAYASTYKRDIDERIAHADQAIAHTEKRLAFGRVQVNRLENLSSNDQASQTAVDATMVAALDLERRLTELKAELERATVRREGANQGVLLLDDGADGAEAFRNSLEEMRLNLSRTRSDLDAAKAEITATELVLDTTRAIYDKETRFGIEARLGAMVWNLMASPGSSVQTGMPVISWIDCGIMLVDVPVSDVELALLAPGDTADVILEGERHLRRGTVLLERGAAATMGNTELAALAKGRAPGIGQVLVKLFPSDADINACPIGNAAYVDFPGLGLLDIVKARLRL